jgi:predicted HD superfamily hydrolase involved in NAD metabolism
MHENIIEKLKNNLSSKRLKHTFGVSDTAADLASLYGADIAKARLAGLLHDCARELPEDVLLQMAESYGIEINDVERREPILLHAAVGAFIAKRDFAINDSEVLRAITLHTTGAPIMSLLDNIVFLADFIEPGRAFSGVEKLRALAKKDLYGALIAAYDHTLEYLISKQGLIHSATVEGRNALLTRT